LSGINGHLHSASTSAAPQLANKHGRVEWRTRLPVRLVPAAGPAPPRAPAPPNHDIPRHASKLLSFLSLRSLPLCGSSNPALPTPRDRLMSVSKPDHQTRSRQQIPTPKFKAATHPHHRPAAAMPRSADWYSADLSRLGGSEKDCRSAAAASPARPSEPIEAWLSASRAKASAFGRLPVGDTAEFHSALLAA